MLKGFKDFIMRGNVIDLAVAVVVGAAFAAGSVAYITQSVTMGLLAAVLVSVLLSLVHGYASITQRGSQIVSGVAINFVVAGSTVILGEAWFRQGGRTPALTEDGRFGRISGLEHPALRRGHGPNGPRDPRRYGRCI